MDRNKARIAAVVTLTWSLSARRAWIEIAVATLTPTAIMSLSARRAWIEITECRAKLYRGRVALRKESVDRNRCLTRTFHGLGSQSLSARRAWIEMIVNAPVLVALACRSPQGERG